MLMMLVKANLIQVLLADDDGDDSNGELVATFHSLMGSRERETFTSYLGFRSR